MLEIKEGELKFKRIKCSINLPDEASSLELVRWLSSERADRGPTEHSPMIETTGGYCRKIS
jgi:hypothetical protein